MVESLASAAKLEGCFQILDANDGASSTQTVHYLASGRPTRVTLGFGSSISARKARKE
jgi:hypothetical protein